jgi:predicted O-linked N-acetylglucosamine transferase (SPINDLY family)
MGRVAVLTCAGNTFASRVVGSLLRAVALPELVTKPLEEYEALAMRLVCEPELLTGLRARPRITGGSLSWTPKTRQVAKVEPCPRKRG